MKTDPGSPPILKAIAAAVTAEELRLEALGRPGAIRELLAEANGLSAEARAQLDEVCRL